MIFNSRAAQTHWFTPFRILFLPKAYFSMFISLELSYSVSPPTFLGDSTLAQFWTSPSTLSYDFSTSLCPWPVFLLNLFFLQTIENSSNATPYSLHSIACFSSVPALLNHLKSFIEILFEDFIVHSVSHFKWHTFSSYDIVSIYYHPRLHDIVGVYLAFTRILKQLLTSSFMIFHHLIS